MKDEIVPIQGDPRPVHLSQLSRLEHHLLVELERVINAVLSLLFRIFERQVRDAVLVQDLCFPIIINEFTREIDLLVPCPHLVKEIPRSHVQ